MSVENDVKSFLGKDNTLTEAKELSAHSGLTEATSEGTDLCSLGKAKVNLGE